MDVKDIDLGWNKIVQKLQDLAKQEVDIGIQSGEMSEDGETDMATIAAVHEFGAVIHRDAGTVTNYRKIKKDGSFAKNGRFVKKKSSNFATTASRKAHDIYIPQRSFLRAAFDEKELVIGQHADKKLPQFTSCCPAWVKFMETYYPDMLEHLSTAKSPIGMQGPTIKTYFAKKMGLDPKKIVNVALTPCTAKKFEIRRDEMCAAGKYHGDETMRDMDFVITTRELAMLAKDENIDFVALEDASFDEFMGIGTGAGVIFGNTGGVMEAAVRSAYAFITKEDVPADLLQLEAVRGMQGIREAELTIAGKKLKVAVVYGTANARKLVEKIRNGNVHYDFVEVMTCPGGCIGGGGQPKDREYKGDALREKRIQGLYARDNSVALRSSHLNPQIQKVYEEFYGEPLSELAEQMLHTMYQDRSADLGGHYIAPAAEEKTGSAKKYRCKVCGYIYEGDSLPEGYTCPVCKMGSEMFEEIKENAAVTKKYRCKVCGYIYEGDSLPEGYTCPICKMGSEMFEEIE